MSNSGLRWSEEWLADWYRKQQGLASDPQLNELRFVALKALATPHKLGRGQRIEIDGIKFASLAESRRYESLKLLEKAREIFFLQAHPSWSVDINGIHICRVVADFGYLERASGRYIVEDVKKTRYGKDGKVKFTTNTPLSKIKQRLLLARHGVEIALIEDGVVVGVLKRPDSRDKGQPKRTIAERRQRNTGFNERTIPD